MGNWREHKSSNRVKLLLAGDSGAGKTSQLGLLANAGYKVVIADFAEGLDSLGGILDEVGVENVYFKTFRDDTTTDGAKAEAWAQFKRELRKGDWGGMGPISNWGDDVVFAVDDLSGATDAVKHYALAISGKKMHDRPSLPDWGNINDELDVYLMQGLTSPQIQCNVIFNTHWVPVDDEDGISRFFPKVGTKSNSVHNSGRHLNNVIWIKSNRKGERTFRTSGDSSRDLKTARRLPTEVEANMPELFKLLTE